MRNYDITNSKNEVDVVSEVVNNDQIQIGQVNENTYKKYRSILFFLLSSLAKYMLMGGILGGIILDFICREDIVTSGIGDFMTTTFQGIIIGIMISIIIFLFKGFNPEKMQSLGSHIFLFGYSIFAMDTLSGGFLFIFLSLVLRLLLCAFYAISFMPLMIVYCTIMTIIETFVNIPESVGDMTDHLPKILSIIFVIIMLIKFLSKI